MSGPVSSLDVLTQPQDAEQFAAEQTAQQAATQPISTQLQATLAFALAAWAVLGEDDAAGRKRVTVQLQLELQRIAKSKAVKNLPTVLHEHARKALALGVMHGGTQAGFDVAGTPAGRSSLTSVFGVPLKIPDLVEQRIADAPAVARHAIDRAVGVLKAAQSRADVEAAMAVAHQAVTRTAATAGYAVNRSAAVGVHAVADGLGLARLWIGERDACLHCLAYFGVLAAPGETFPTGLTYGRKPFRWPVPDPPLHPNCRCRIVVFRGAAGDHEFADALKREARRSVLRGWSLESESNASRVDAAGRLLARISGSGLAPVSVETYAARAVRLGTFPRGRRFPA